MTALKDATENQISKRNSWRRSNQPTHLNTRREKEDQRENNALTALKTSMMTKEATLPTDNGTTMTEMYRQLDLVFRTPRLRNLTRPSVTTRRLFMTSLKKEAALENQTHRVTSTKSRGRWPCQSTSRERNLTKLKRTLTRCWASTIDLRLNTDE